MKKKLTALALSVSLTVISGANAYAQTTDRYYVRPGDTLWEISQKYKVKLNDVINSNPHFTDPNLIYPNDIVIVPLDGGAWSSTGEIGASVIDSGNGTVIENPIYKFNTKSSVKAIAVANDFEKQVAELVNDERTRHGLQTLVFAAELSNIARVKSEDMRDNNYFSHTSASYGSPFDMIKQFGVSYKTAGENIAKGQKTPQDVMNAWMSSEGHRRNILNSNFKEIGVGYVTDKSGNTFWTQQFVER